MTTGESISTIEGTWCAHRKPWAGGERVRENCANKRGYSQDQRKLCHNIAKVDQEYRTRSWFGTTWAVHRLWILVPPVSHQSRVESVGLTGETWQGSQSSTQAAVSLQTYKSNHGQARYTAQPKSWWHESEFKFRFRLWTDNLGKGPLQPSEHIGPYNSRGRG